MSNDEVKVYQDKKAKAEDFKSSAYTLLLTGFLGWASLGLMELGMLPIQFAAPGKYFTYAVMGGLFAVFILIGLLSYRSAKKYEREAENEENLTAQIKDWVHNNLSADKVKEQVPFAEDTPDEMRYFAYFAAIKESVVQTFGTLDASYVESVCEELYAELFDTDNP